MHMGTHFSDQSISRNICTSHIHILFVASSVTP